MKIISLLTTALLLLVFGCRQKDPSPAKQNVSTSCRLTSMSVTYDSLKTYSKNGIRENWTFEYDAKGFMIKYTNRVTDLSSKDIGTQTGNFTYNAQGQLEKLIVSGNLEGESYETYTYANGKLTNVKFFKDNQQVYQYDITTNSAGNITRVVATPLVENNPKYYFFDARQAFNNAGLHERTEFYDKAGKLNSQVVNTDANTGIHSPYESWKGLPFDFTRGIYNYINGSLGSWQAFNKQTAMSTFDNGTVGPMKPTHEFKYSHKVNSQGYLIELAEDQTVLATGAKTDSRTLYTYTGCK